jgi:hypothetical protein
MIGQQSRVKSFLCSCILFQEDHNCSSNHPHGNHTESCFPCDFLAECAECAEVSQDLSEKSVAASMYQVVDLRLCLLEAVASKAKPYVTTYIEIDPSL